MLLVVKLYFAITLEAALLLLFHHSLALAVKEVDFSALFQDYCYFFN